MEININNRTEFFSKEYKVSLCPICIQGIVQICKDEDLNQLYLMCQECYSEWEDIRDNDALHNLLPFDTHKSLVEPTVQEIKDKGWYDNIVWGKVSIPMYRSLHERKVVEPKKGFFYRFKSYFS